MESDRPARLTAGAASEPEAAEPASLDARERVGAATDGDGVDPPAPDHGLEVSDAPAADPAPAAADGGVMPVALDGNASSVSPGAGRPEVASVEEAPAPVHAFVSADDAPPAAAAPSTVAAVEFDRVTKTYARGMTALKDVSLRIDPGEFVFIVGRTGVGKSTLLKMIYREELPTEGHVVVHGTDVTTLPARQVPFLRRRLGVVFQDFKLLPRKTAWENVAFALEVTGTPRTEVAPRVEEALEVVGLAAHADALPGQLSAGEQQRISIARALVHRPSLLLADEPTGNLDPESSWEIVQLLSEINRHATTIVVATHDKVIVDALRRRVIVVQSGVVVRDDARGSYDGE